MYRTKNRDVLIWRNNSIILGLLTSLNYQNLIIGSVNRKSKCFRIWILIFNELYIDDKIHGSDSHLVYFEHSKCKTKTPFDRVKMNCAARIGIIRILCDALNIHIIMDKI